MDRTASSVPAGLDIRLLGPVGLAVEGAAIGIGSQKQRIVLAMLALGPRVSVDSLVDELWRESPPASVGATLQSLVYRLRRLLEGTGPGVTIRTDAAGYVLEAEPASLDVHRFHQHAGAGRRALEDGAPGKAATCFREALSEWRGPALADLADCDFARVAAARLDEARLDVSEELAEAELSAGYPGAALEVLDGLVADHPYRERPRGQQMVALYRLGRQRDALAVYQDVRRVLADDLGLDPTPALVDLERRVLLQSPDLLGTALLGTARERPPAEAPRPAPEMPDVTGMLAFLFTDIESSTRRWEGDRDAMAADLADHDAVLRRALRAHGGHQFTHTGDGLGAVFPTAAAAVAATLAGQRALAGVPWRGDGPLRVRMAIHVGTAESRDGTFLGPALNRAARLLDEAGGGQILCSQAAADLARDELPGGVTLVDRGERRLPGLARPERLWQVLHPALAETVGPRPAARSSAVPAALTSFIGREAELSELGELLPTTRLLTITGLGGAGKTRLAFELAERHEQHFRDGACLVELARQRDGEMVAGEVLAALGVAADGERSDTRVCRVLSPRHQLLVLDNCEHLLESVAALVYDVLRSCPEVCVVATSRELLSVPGETHWPAPGLSQPTGDGGDPADLEAADSVALFVTRARTAQPGFALTAANAEAVTRICRRLDGIPLALELAAARVVVLGVGALAERLDDRFRLLVGGPRQAPSRHQTLRATMDWSFEMLRADEQRLLRRLSAFPQSFDLEAATAVAGDGADALDVLDVVARLVNRSLVTPEGDSTTARYRLLETVRHYGAERLTAAGESQEIALLHRRHFAGRVESAYRANVDLYASPWSHHILTERENYTVALDGALAEGDMEAVCVLLSGLHWPAFFWWLLLPRWLTVIDPDSLYASNADFHVEALLTLANAGWMTARYSGNDVGGVYDRALAVATQRGSSEKRGMVLHLQAAYLARNQGETVTARSLMNEALAAIGDDSPKRVWPAYELGWLDMTEANAGQARGHFERTEAMLGDAPGQELAHAHLRAALGLAAAATGDGATGLGWVALAVEDARAVDSPAVLVMALVRAAEAAAVAGVAGGRHLVEALRLLHDHSAHRWVAEALTVAALAHEGEGRAALAGRLLGGAAALAVTLGDPEPLPVIGALVDAARLRLDGTLGAEACAREIAAGQQLPASSLLQAALEGM